MILNRLLKATCFLFLLVVRSEKEKTIFGILTIF
jgi:hypothetical protein